MKETVYRSIWTVGTQVRNAAKHLGMLGPLETVLIRLAPYIVPPPSGEVTVALPWGMTMALPPGIPSARTYAANLYEPEVTALLRSTLRAGMSVCDLGANVGYYTLLAAHLVGPAGRVYAFEPDPTNHAYLVRNVAANGCRNVEVVGKAVSSGAAAMTFARDARGAEGFLTTGVPVGTSITVQTVSLDEFFAAQGWPSVDLIKMDIEGGEQGALEGMHELCRNNPGLQVVMELNPDAMQRAGSTRSGMAGLLKSLGFRRGRVVERNLEPFAIIETLPGSGATYNLLLQR